MRTLGQIIERNEGRIAAIVADYVSEINSDYPNGIPSDYEFVETRYLAAEILAEEGVEDAEMVNELQEFIEAKIKDNL
jgi:hypothetical protein